MFGDQCGRDLMPHNIDLGGRGANKRDTAKRIQYFGKIPNILAMVVCKGRIRGNVIGKGSRPQMRKISDRNGIVSREIVFILVGTPKVYLAS